MTAGKRRQSEYTFVPVDSPPIRIPAEELDKRRDAALRQALLMQVDAIERRWGISPTTAEIRKEDKAARKAEESMV